MDDNEHIHIFGDNFEIICGTNEEFLLAFTIKYSQDGQLVLYSSFANHSHCSGVRRLAICGPYLVSGGTDEMIHVFNLKKRNKIGVIGEHEGTITDIQQYKQKYVFSTSEDGKICIFREGKWECEKRLLGHKGTINSLAIHPTGRLALSVGVDRTLHTWDLVKGRKAHVSTLNDVGSMVKWAPSGDQYVVIVDSRVDVYVVNTAMIDYSADFHVRVNDIAFVKANLFVVALENGKVALHNTQTHRTLQQWEAHENRVRSLAVMPVMTTYEDEHPSLYLVTGSSDGWLKVWALQKDNLKAPAVCISSKNTQCRVTCLTVYTDDDYRQAVKARTQEQLSAKADHMLVKSKKSGIPKNRVMHEDESEDEQKPVLVQPPAKKRKKVTMVQPESEEESELEDDEATTKLEVIQGTDALKALGYKNNSSNSSKKKKKKVLSEQSSTARHEESDGKPLKRAGRKNRGIPARRFLD